MITVALRESMGLASPVPPAKREGGLASSRLDRSTFFDRVFSPVPAERRFAVRFYKKAGICQVSWGVYKLEQRKQGARQLTEDEKKANQVRAKQRAVANLRRDLLSISADHMLTLTYRENMTDRKQALRDLAKFIRVMRRKYSYWASVAVLEYQERGCCHFHIGIHGFWDVNEVREEWRQVVGNVRVKDAETGEEKIFPNGNIDIAFKPKGRGNSCSKLASYMAKYLSEDIDIGRKEGEHRYFRTQGIDRPREVYYVPASFGRGWEREVAFATIQDLLSINGISPTLWSRPGPDSISGYVSGERNT